MLTYELTTIGVRPSTYTIDLIVPVAVDVAVNAHGLVHDQA
jgi:hypothetical protein